MKKRLLSWLLCAAMVLGLLPTMAVTALADELAEAYTLSDDYISVSVSKKNGGFTVRTVEGDRLKKSDNNKKLLYHDGQYDTSFLSFRVGEGNAAKDYIFGGSYPSSSGVAVTEESGTVKAVWSVDGLTFTQSIALANTSSNESGMVSLSLSVTNGSGAAVPVQTRILYDTALGEQDFGYYQYNNTSTQKAETISQEKVLTSDIPQQLFATDDPYSPSVLAYSVNNDKQPTKVAFGHWSHLASTLFDFTPVETLDFTNTRSEYMTADSAYALYFNLGSVAAGGSTSLNTYYGVFSNHKTPASDSVAVNLTAPVRLKLSDDKSNFVPESGVKGSAHFAVTVDFTNIAGEGAQDLSNVVLAVRSSRNLRSLTDEGGTARGQDYETTDPFTIPYAELKVGESETKTLYFQVRPSTDAAYERITVGVYKPDANGQLSETNKLGERMAYVLLPGSDGDVPEVSFAAMTPKIIYTEGTRHLFVTVTNPDLLADTGKWDLKVYSEDKKVSVPVPHENITIKDGIMDVALTEDIKLSEGGWYLQLEWANTSAAPDGKTLLQTAPELHFTVSADKKYKNDAYGVLAVVEHKSGSYYSHEIVSFKSEDDFNQFKNDTVQYEEILLTFKGEFTATKTYSYGGTKQATYYTATSKKTLVDGKYEVDNPIVINGCMDFEGGSLNLYYEDYEGKNGLPTSSAICTEFDGELYTNTERTSIWKGKAILTKITNGTGREGNYSLIPYNENGERGSYDPADKTKLMTDNGKSFNEQNKPITLIWPSAAGIGQTLSGMIFKLAYAQLGIMYNTENQTNKIEETIGCVVSFTAALDLTFASGKVDENAAEPPTYWSKLQELWSSYDELQSGSLYQYAYNSGKLERALDWSEIDESGGEDNEKNIKGSVMVRDVLFGCGEGFIGVNFEVGVAIKNYISGLPEIEGTIAVSTINDWAFGVDGKIELANFTVEAKVSFKSKNNIPIPDELYVFVSGFEPGLNIDGCGVIWLTGGGGGIKNLYDTIFMTQAVPPLKLLMSVSFDVVKVLTCEKATLSLGLTGISLQAENIGIKKIESLTAIKKMGLSLEWYPGIDLRANIVVNLFDGVIYGGGYIVLISPDYKDVFFEMFARAKLSVPGSVPIVGGMTLAGIDLGISTEKVWGALDVLFITLGVTYYWGEGSVDFSKGSKSNPTFPDLLGYDDIPVYYDAEHDQTLYARVGTNTQIMATSLPDDGGLTLMATGAELHCTEGNSKTAYWFNLGQRQNEADAIVQITFDANDMADAKAKAAAIKVGSTEGGSDFGLVLYEQKLDAEGNLVSSNRGTANANLSYDETTKKATYAFTATMAEQYGKPWYMATPAGSDVILYNVSEVPKVETVSGTVDNNAGTLAVNWDGSELSELDQISFYLCSSNDPENTDPGYRVDAVDSDPGSKSATLAIPADVPSDSYYIRAVYSKSDEVNGVVFSQNKVSWTNSNTPGAASFTAKAAGNLQYKLDIARDTTDKTDGYLVTIYNADGTATDFQQVSYDAADSGSTVINVGGSYQAADPEDSSKVKTFGLTGGRTYTIGVTPYQKVTSGSGETAVYGKEVTETCHLPEMVTPTVTFSANKAAQSRTETQQDKAENTYTAKKDVYTANKLTITAKVSEAVTGTWRLDSAKSSTPFNGTASISIPLTDLTEGEHTVTLQGAAADGDSFAATYTFTVDTLPPQLLLSSPVNGSFFDKNGTLTVTGVTDADARFTVVSNGTPIYTGKILESSEFNPADGTFSFSVALPDPNSASQHDLTITVADDVGNATVPQSVTVSHGGLADLASLEVMVNGQTYSNGNLPVPAAGLKNVPLTLVGVTSNGTKFSLTGYNVNWELTTVEGTASLSDGALTAAALSQGMVTGKLAVANGAYRTASLCFGALANHIVAVSSTIGGSVTGGGEYNGGETVTLTAIPDNGYRFAGWTVTGASVADLTAATITFTMPRVGNVTALASFVPVSSSGGADLSSESVSAKAGEVVRVKLPAGKSETEYLPCHTDNSGKLALVPISAVIDGYVTFLAPKSGTYRFTSNPVAFSDTANHWAADAISFCASRELFKGIGGGRFAPNEPMTRAMFATVLYRIAGMPAVSGANSFYDVAAGQWYTDAILWGQSTGIISGYGNGLFGTNDLVTREQMCVMLSRYLQWAGYELPAVTAAKQFGDKAQISKWAADNVAFCQTRGLINGQPNNRFAPKANATRAENSTVLRRMILAILASAETP